MMLSPPCCRSGCGAALHSLIVAACFALQEAQGLVEQIAGEWLATGQYNGSVVFAHALGKTECPISDVLVCMRSGTQRATCFTRVARHRAVQQSILHRSTVSGRYYLYRSVADNHWWVSEYSVEGAAPDRHKTGHNHSVQSSIQLWEQ